MFGKLQELHPTRWAATFCGLVVLMVSAVAHSGGATPPNILLLVAEDLGARLVMAMSMPRRRILMFSKTKHTLHSCFYHRWRLRAQSSRTHYRTTSN